MKRPNPKLFMILMVVTLLAGSALAYFQYTSLSDATQRVVELQAEVRDEQEVLDELAELKEKVKATESKLTHLEKGVSELEYVPTLLKEIEKTGEEAGLLVLGVRPIPKAVAVKPKNASGGEVGEGPVRKAYTEMDIEIRCRGNYRSVMNFVKALQMFPKIVAARTVSLQPKSGSANERQSTPMLEATLEMRSYVFATDGEKRESEEDEAPTPRTINVSGRNKGVE